MKQPIIVQWNKVNSDQWKSNILKGGKIVAIQYTLKKDKNGWTAYRGDEMTSLRGYDLNELKLSIQMLINAIQ